MDNSEDTGTRVIRHTREDVTRAALSILDELGLPDLTMRRLAAVLNVQPSALYWHFANKQSLLAAVSDSILEQLRPATATDDWRADLHAEARALRDALLAYRDGAEVVSSTLALGLGGDQAEERLAAAISRGGFDERISAAAARAVLHFILGHVSREQQHLQASSLGAAREPAGPLDDEDSAGGFEFGITLLAGGLEAYRMPGVASLRT
ncbi:TetR family transcriptional regulator [Diaminobutyricibacter tongyongensis]|uniref:TetR family transcriptional regulator n=1 Tax=Leifsonia tongyongensis TaxID=1268043 RepID=A0A6L9XXH8_9MICO|nr:TetR/AcrR family transcriptional regulator C-terminal domain-containing protein [Diaminobutyricibacter tongyongensis]NEN05754.1 TetR family transcriptional regulator [Diaminobutyricibacter tongyongensis]